MKIRSLLLLGLLILGTACQTADITIPENIQDISQPMAENLLTSLENNDFEMFTKDFSAKMAASVDSQTFTTLQEATLQTVGTYTALAYEGTNLEDGYLVSYFKATFSNGELTLRMILSPKEPYLIEGFWFPDFPTE